MSDTCTPSRAPRLTGWTLVTIGLLFALALIAPEQLQVILYKTGLVTLAAVLAYWLDRALFPNGRPHSCTPGLHIAAAWIRRALIVVGCILGLTLGL